MDEEDDDVDDEHDGRGSPAAGKRGSANVQIVSTTVIDATNRCSRRTAATKTVAKR